MMILDIFYRYLSVYILPPLYFESEWLCSGLQWTIQLADPEWNYFLSGRVCNNISEGRIYGKWRDKKQVSINGRWLLLAVTISFTFS